MDQTLIIRRDIPSQGYQALSQKKKTLEKAQTSLQMERRNNEGTVNCLPCSLQTKATRRRGPRKLHHLRAVNVLNLQHHCKSLSELLTPVQRPVTVVRRFK